MEIARPAAKTASRNNIDTRCQTGIATAARHLEIIERDLAVALSICVSQKNVFLRQEDAGGEVFRVNRGSKNVFVIEPIGQNELF